MAKSRTRQRLDDWQRVYDLAGRVFDVYKRFAPNAIDNFGDLADDDPDQRAEPLWDLACELAGIAKRNIKQEEAKKGAQEEANKGAAP
jgi:hypothetical protein